MYPSNSQLNINIKCLKMERNTQEKALLINLQKGGMKVFYVSRLPKLF